MIVIEINVLTLLFGLNNFTFYQGKLLEENYSLKEFITLSLIYLGFYLSIGLVALASINIVQEGFKEYDRHSSVDFANANSFLLIKHILFDFCLYINSEISFSISKFSLEYE